MTLPEKTTFDYSVVTQEQAVQLQIISARIKVRVERTAEEMLAMGADLQEAKQVCKENGKLFEDWCGSGECPVSATTARRLMSVHAQLGNKKNPEGFFEHGFKVLAEITQTRDEDIRQALLEHIEQEAEDGKQVTQQEITALKKALSSEQERVKDLQGEVFDAKSLIKGYMAERDEAKQQRDNAIISRDKAIHELMEKDTLIKQKDSAIRAKMEELQDAEEVFKEQLAEMRQEIVEEERKRPKTDAEIEAKRQKLIDLEEQERDVKRNKFDLQKEVRDLKEQLSELEKQRKVWTKIVNDFYAAGVKFHQEAAMLIGAAQTLSDIPLTEELHSQIETIIKDADKVAEVLRDAVAL